VDPFAWIDPRSEEEKATLRTAIAKASKGEKFGDHDQPREIEEKRAWFKREHGGEQLARLLLARRRSLKDQAVAKPLRSLKAFIYPDVTDRPDEK
jgi:hypothetical protein